MHRIRQDLLSVELANDGEHNDAQRHDNYLVTSSDCGGEEHRMCGRTEDIAVDLLPAILISQVTLLGTHKVQYNSPKDEDYSFQLAHKSIKEFFTIAR